MAGNQVLEWADLDTEIKTADLKDVSDFFIGVLCNSAGLNIVFLPQDPLAPPDL